MDRTVAVRIARLVAAGALACLLGSAAAAGVRESKFELFVTDVAASARFYEALGFEIVVQKSDGYTTLRSDGAVIALSPVPAWLPLRWLGFLRHPPIGTEIVLYTEALEAMRADLADAGYEPGEIAVQPWGDRDFRITDHDGYYVRVSEGAAIPGLPRAPEPSAP